MGKRSRPIAAGAIGNLLEFYDFAIFAYLAPVIGVLFFPSDSPLASLLKAYGVFAAGFLMRPLGAVLFGHFGDRLGRKKILQISVGLRAVPTTLVGCLPTYDQEGPAVEPIGQPSAEKSHDHDDTHGPGIDGQTLMNRRLQNMGEVGWHPDEDEVAEVNEGTRNPPGG